MGGAAGYPYSPCLLKKTTKMKTENFENLIRVITGRDFTIKTDDKELKFETDYLIFRKTPIKQITVSFNWKTPKSDEKMLRSFITAFATKYREPDPATFNYEYGGKKYTWEEKTPEQKEHCYFVHATHMYNKEDLLKQVEANFSKEGIASDLLRYGFYNTEYGIGIFCFWMTNGVQTAIQKMATHLQQLSIPFTNEFSDARWVYRFKIGLSKDTHLNLINKLN